MSLSIGFVPRSNPPPSSERGPNSLIVVSSFQNGLVQPEKLNEGWKAEEQPNKNGYGVVILLFVRREMQIDHAWAVATDQNKFMRQTTGQIL